MTNLAMKEKNLEFINDMRNLKNIYARISKLSDYEDIDIILTQLSDENLKSLYDASLDSLDNLKEMVKCQKIAINLYLKEVNRRNRERKVIDND